MAIVLDGTNGITTSGNNTLGDASTDTLNVGNGGLVKDASGNLFIANPGTIGFSSTNTAAGVGINSVGKTQIARDSVNTVFALQSLQPAGTSYLQEYIKGQSTIGFMSATSTGLTLSGINGLSFTATQTASSDANTLDDYEEGTYTPEFLALSGTMQTVNYGTRYGKYTKIGNTVTVSFLVPWTSTSGVGSGLLALSMPFAPYQNGGAHNGFGGIAYASGLPVNCFFYGDSGSSRAILIKANSVNSYYSPSEISSGGGQIMGSFIFHTT